MRPPGQWLKPQKTLLLALFVVTSVAIATLGWFGRRLLEQERVVEAQRAKERQEQAGDRIAADMREALAEAGERVGSWALSLPPDGTPAEGVAVIVAGNILSVSPRHRLLYRPRSLEAEPSAMEASDDLFSDGEELEFRKMQLAPALEWYQKLTDAKEPAARAGALIRMARVLRKMARVEQARAVYARLEAIDARAAGVPVELVARHALAELSGKKADARSLKQDLLAARWSLSRGQFEFYWSEALRLSGDSSPLPEESAALSEAISQGWDGVMHDQNPGGQITVWVADRPFLLIWRGAANRRAVLATRPESVFRQVLARPDLSRGLSSVLVDSEGRTILGRRSEIFRPTVRTPAETRLPWTLYVTAAQSAVQAGMIARQRFLAIATGLIALVLIAGAYVIARAIRTEIEVSRMQSDFVSAVSHEFRSPLTSMRQLSEILALGRVPNEERRQVYYETLVRETVRLQRLVEGLLNFGRMEAGVRKFRFEETDATQLVASVAAEFEPQFHGTGKRIEIAAKADCCIIDADPEALTVALRNLVDNAVKYAPDCPTIWVECGVENDRVAIRVRDKGPGIPRSEHRAIFRRFVRGSAAAAANVKGSGVGLAMVRHIVAAHRGNISVESAPGMGSTFTILLPVGAKAT
jgi:signal transduction histidine kinase